VSGVVGTSDSVHSKSILDGEYDVQVDWEIISSIDSNRWEVSLTVSNTLLTRLYRIDRQYRSGVNSIVAWRNEGFWQSLGQFNTTATSGSFRITRTNSNDISMYYDIGGGWVLLGADLTGNTGDHIVILASAVAENNPDTKATFDNFKVNSVDNLICADSSSSSSV
jgi:hypothetical protein